jgi:DNA-binding winged helix-turn-helix (wHTH) protein
MRARAISPQKRLRFGAFELNASAGELRKHGIRIRLQEQPMKLLTCLVESPGVILSREDLIPRIWPDGVFVDYERGLNSALTRLRQALVDSAESPRYIETVARQGYRFIAPVVEVSDTEQARPQPAPREHWIFFATVLAVALGATIVSLTALLPGRTSPLSAQQVTFSKGFVWSARFTPDGNTIVYGAAWQGNPVRLFAARLDSPQSRPIGEASADVLAISSKGEMALSLSRHVEVGSMTQGRLASSPLGGGAPREILENVREADWSPDGKRLLIVHRVAGHDRLEYLGSKVLYQTSGWISHARISPGGDRVAFIDHQVLAGDGGAIVLVDSGGKTRILSRS